MSYLCFRAYADEKRYLYTQVRVFDTRKAMLDDIMACGFGHGKNGRFLDRRVAGQSSGLTHYNRSGRMTGRFNCIWLNRQDLRRNPSEIVSHECVHAAMRYATNKRANLSEMEGEESLCYAAGTMMRAITNRLYKLGVFKEA